MRPKKPYHKRQRAPQRIVQLCGDAWPEDGLDPRYDVCGHGSRQPGRKALQLCGQVTEALTAVLAECADPVLQALRVVGVQPAPHSGRLLVLLEQPPSDCPEARERLTRAGGLLRCGVAAAITRKKSPELVFCLLTSCSES